MGTMDSSDRRLTVLHHDIAVNGYPVGNIAESPTPARSNLSVAELFAKSVSVIGALMVAGAGYGIAFSKLDGAVWSPVLLAVPGIALIPFGALLGFCFSKRPPPVQAVNKKC